MSIRFILGRAGTGKTRYCLEAARERLRRDALGGARAFLLVPEQASLQTERELLLDPDVAAFSRVEVLSFRRLALRILGEAGGAGDRALTPIGRKMVLRHLLGCERRHLKCYGRMIDRPGLVSELDAALTELMHERIDPDVLARAAGQLNPDSSAAGKTHDVVHIYRAYLEYLEQGTADPERYLDLAAERLKKCPWAAGCEVWVDGFAGFTAQELNVLVELARLAERMEIALLLDPTALPEDDKIEAERELRLFGPIERTYAELRQRFAAAGPAIERPMVLHGAPPRFAGAPGLARLERDLFAIAPADESGTSTAGDVEVFSFADRRHEVEAALARVQDLVRRPEDALRYRDIGIIVRDLEPYHDLVSAACAERGIPVFIDRRRPVLHHPLIELARAACLLGVQDFSGESISLLIKTGLIPLADEALDELENYVLAYGIAGATLWLEKQWGYWGAPGGDREEEPVSRRERERLRAVNRTRKELLALLGEWVAVCREGGTRTGGEWVAALRRALERLGVVGRLETWADCAEAEGRAGEAQEDREVLREFAALLEDLELGMGGVDMDLSGFLDVLGAGLGELTLGLAPPTVDELLVGAIARSRHPRLRAVMLLGCNERAFPRVPAEPTILNDDDREALAEASAATEGRAIRLGSTRRQRLCEERLLGYVAMTRASEALWISFPRADEQGRKLYPSPFIEAACRAAGGLAAREIEDPVVSRRLDTVGSGAGLAGGLAAEMGTRPALEAEGRPERRAAWNRIYAECLGNDALRPRMAAALASLEYVNRAELDDRLVERLFERTIRSSVTRLETFAACPFRHFARYGLKLEEREEHRLEALELGTLSHDVLERFISVVLASAERIHELDDETLDRRLRALAAESAAALHDQILLSQARNQYLIERCARDLGRSLAGHREYSRRSQFRPRAVELGFGFDADDALPALMVQTAKGRRLELCGWIDRVDVAELEDRVLLAVIDYKRQRHRTLSLADVFHGLALQLVGYLLALQQHGESWLGRPVEPAGAFYVTLLRGNKSVDRPAAETERDETTEGGDAERMRGLLNGQRFEAFDSATGQGRSPVVAAYRKTDGSFGFPDATDVASSAEFGAVLEHVRRRIADLGDRMLDGDIRVAPARLHDWVPCTACEFRSVCRFDYQTDRPRRLETLSRSQALNRMAGKG